MSESTSRQKDSGSCAEEQEQEQQEWKTVSFNEKSRRKYPTRNSSRFALQLEKSKLYASSLKDIPIVGDTVEQIQEISAQTCECMVALWSFGRDSFLQDMISSCCTLHLSTGDTTKNPIFYWQSLHEVREIVCYGIGNFSRRYSAEMLQMSCAFLLRYLLDIVQNQRCCFTCTEIDVAAKHEKGQLKFSNDGEINQKNVESFFHSLELKGFLSHLKKHDYGKRSTIKMSFYDPCMTHLEKRMLEEQFNVAPIVFNEQGKRKVEPSHQLTIFYMPHCPMRLYSNVIWANWEKAVLKCVIILGNSLLTYNDRTIDSTERNDPTNAIFRIAPFVIEKRLWWKPKQRHRLETNGSPLANALMAFNDFSVSFFPSTLVSDAFSRKCSIETDQEQTPEWPSRPVEFFVSNSEISELR